MQRYSGEERGALFAISVTVMIYYAHSGIGLNNRFPLRQQLLYGTYKKKAQLKASLPRPFPFATPGNSRQAPFGSEVRQITENELK